MQPESSTVGITGILLGSTLSILSQFIFFYGIERIKLKTEREFSFRKEEYFKLQEKSEEIHANFNKINNFIIFSMRENNGEYRDILNYIEKIEGLTRIYFNELYDIKYINYNNSIDLGFRNRGNNFKEAIKCHREFAEAINEFLQAKKRLV